MSESVYKVIEVIGSSGKSWEDAARMAIEHAAKSLKDIRVGEVVEQDMKVEDGKVTLFRTKVRISFRYHNE